MNRAEILREFRPVFLGLALLAVVMACTRCPRTPAAGLNDFTARYVVDADGTWWRVYVPAKAEFVRLAEDGRHYRLHYADHTQISFPTPGWTLYDGRSRETTVLTSPPREGSP